MFHVEPVRMHPAAREEYEEIQREWMESFADWDDDIDDVDYPDSYLAYTAPPLKEWEAEEMPIAWFILRHFPRWDEFGLIRVDGFDLADPYYRQFEHEWI